MYYTHLRTDCNNSVSPHFRNTRPISFMHRPLQTFTKTNRADRVARPYKIAVDEHSWSSIPKMSRSKTCCPLSATACGIFVGTINYWKSICLAPEQGAEKHLRVSAINRIQRLFLPTFSGKTDGTKLQTSGAFAIWRGRATERTRPAACGGARDVEFVRTRVCEATVAASP